MRTLTRHLALLAPLVVLGACSEQEYSITDRPPEQPTGDLKIIGQVCDPVQQIWLKDALVYTHLYDENDIVFDTKSDITDENGFFELEGLAGGMAYEIYVQKGQSILEQYTVTMPEAENLFLPQPACFGDTDLQVAVVTGAYDDMETVFDALGIGGYRLIDGQKGDEIIDFLSDVANVQDYDVLFFDGGHKEEDIVWGDDAAVATVQATIEAYVEGGGVLYVTDWAYDVAEQIWPGKINFLGDDDVPDAAQKGEPAEVVADIVNDGLAGATGLTLVPLSYDMSEWPVIEEVDPEAVTVYLSGDVTYREGFDVLQVQDSPLLVQFEPGDGKVIVSTFRNSTNSSGEALTTLGVLIGSIEAAN